MAAARSTPAGCLVPYCRAGLPAAHTVAAVVVVVIAVVVVVVLLVVV